MTIIAVVVFVIVIVAEESLLALLGVLPRWCALSRHLGESASIFHGAVCVARVRSE